jgi:hypothetical protein
MWGKYSGSLLVNQTNFKCKERKRLCEAFYAQKSYCNVFGDVADNVLTKNNETIYAAI